MAESSGDSSGGACNEAEEMETDGKGKGCGLSYIFGKRKKNSDDDDDGALVESSDSNLHTMPHPDEKPARPNTEKGAHGAPEAVLNHAYADDYTQVLEIFRLYKRSPQQYVYNMMHAKRGKLIIINNFKFDVSGLAERLGSEVDAENLKMTFSFLGFDCVMRENQTCTEMLNIIIDATKITDCDVDCVAFAILTHGGAGNVVYGTDAGVSIAQLVSPLRSTDRENRLAGKPKLFFIQACRGKDVDDGLEVTDDRTCRTERKTFYRIPIESDFLYAHSTAPGYYAFRGQRAGSIYIRTLCKMLLSYWSTLDLVKILTRVNHEVAYSFISTKVAKDHPDDIDLNNKKQMPCFISGLTKDLYFLPVLKKS